VSAQTTVTVGPANPINHVIFMLQENHSFDNYLGMLNPYRHGNGWDIGSDGKTYTVDGIDDKLTKISNQDDEGTSYPLFKLRTTCIDDDSSAWLESYGDVNRWDFTTTRKINMDGFVHIAEGFAKNCNASGTCSGKFTDTTGERAMGYYDEDFLNYYYYMASQFAVSDRWFSPLSSKSVPNRIATFAGGTTQGLVFDPGSNDHLPQLSINSIFQELQGAGVSWKIYFTVTQGGCTAGTACGTGSGNMPDTTFLTFSYSGNFVKANPSHAACPSNMKPSSGWGDTSNYYCVDPNHIAPMTQYYTDVKNNTLPSFAFIESGSGLDDEHPGSGQSVLTGQSEVAKVVNALMTSPSWGSSAFFLAYDEGGGPYDHVPPVPGHSNDFTDSSLGSIADISSIAVNPDSYNPCLPSGGTPTTHCDLRSGNPGTKSADAATQYGFRAQLGFRVPNMVISPYTRKHYVSHVPMDHTAVLKFVENRFLGSSAHLTARDAAQPNLLDFFDFTNKPWSTPPTPPAPVTPSSLGYDPCEPTLMGP
jgi:phospholipase C